MYDVSTVSPQGQARLRRVAKVCEGHGTRVQQSVFELILNEEQLAPLEYLLSRIIDPESDSVRIYRVNRQQPMRVLGRSGPFDTTRGSFVV